MFHGLWVIDVYWFMELWVLGLLFSFRCFFGVRGFVVHWYSCYGVNGFRGLAGYVFSGIWCFVFSGVGVNGLMRSCV